MFFKRLTKNKPAPETKNDEAKSTVEAPLQTDPSAISPLGVDALRRTVDGKSLGFKTTADVKPAQNLIGQERALESIEFGLAMKARDYNIFVVGPPGSGKTSLVRVHLAKVAAMSPTPSDWIVVYNFDNPSQPRAIAMPAGRARAFRDALRAALNEIGAALPAAFLSEDYVARRRSIDESFRAGQDDALDELCSQAAQQNIAVLRTPLGFTMAPMHDGKVVKAEVFNQLPDAMRRDVESRIKTLETALQGILGDAPKADRQRRRQLASLIEDISRPVVEDALAELSKSYADHAEITSYLTGVTKDLLAHGGLFVPEPGSEACLALPAQDDVRLSRYVSSVLVASDGDKAGAPVIELGRPTVAALAGQIDAPSHGASGALSVCAGALMRANGGALMADAKELIANPAAWSLLKAALKSGETRIGEKSGQDAKPSPACESEPIPLAVKVVLLGDADTFQVLSQTDPDFVSLFKVQADFDETITRGKDNDGAFAGLVASVIETNGLKQMEAGGVARIMEEAQRLAEDRDKLAIEAGRIADLVREADHWSDEASRKTTTADDVARAIKERARRSDRTRANSHDAIARGILLVDTDGKRSGQVNALSLVQKGSFSFGRPTRITARAHLGAGRVTDIEREVALGGPLHSKGVLILWGFLAARFAQDVPLALSATLVFEQSYETVEGDSASLAELLALLSTLADAPLRQDLAVTGSINQWGEVQAVGGINEKIEGFFDVCSARGLTGSQGVVIPAANAQHLMLREDVVAAVREKRFAVYAIKTADEAASLLTGLESGQRDAEGRFSADTLNGRVEAKLRLYADRTKAYASATSKLAEAGAART